MIDYDSDDGVVAEQAVQRPVILEDEKCRAARIAHRKKAANCEHVNGIAIYVSAPLLAVDKSGWYPALIIAVNEKKRTVRVHYSGWHKRFDFNCPFDSPKIKANMKGTRNIKTATHAHAAPNSTEAANSAKVTKTKAVAHPASVPGKRATAVGKRATDVRKRATAAGKRATDAGRAQRLRSRVPAGYGGSGSGSGSGKAKVVVKGKTNLKGKVGDAMGVALYRATKGNVADAMCVVLHRVTKGKEVRIAVSIFGVAHTMLYILV